jgi:hypothetical protein
MILRGRRRVKERFCWLLKMWKRFCADNLDIPIRIITLNMLKYLSNSADKRKKSLR